MVEERRVHMEEMIVTLSNIVETNNKVVSSLKKSVWVNTTFSGIVLLCLSALAIYTSQVNQQSIDRSIEIDQQSTTRDHLVLQQLGDMQSNVTDIVKQVTALATANKYQERAIQRLEQIVDERRLREDD